jgi:hypothetical protein
VCEELVPKTASNAREADERLELGSPTTAGLSRSSAGPRFDAGFGAGVCVVCLESQKGNSG